MDNVEGIIGLVANALDIEYKKIILEKQLGGMTNKNYKILVDEKAYVLRIPGNGTEDMISRTDEYENEIFANSIGVYKGLVYFNRNSGVKIANFIENAETLTKEKSKRYETIKEVCKLLNTLHNSKDVMKVNFDIYGKFERYENLLNNFNGRNFEDYYEVKNKIIYLKDIMDSFDINMTPCHNDTLADNFIRDLDGRLYLIDWEYGGMNDPMWDLAAYSLENELSEMEEDILLREYFGYEPLTEYRIRILINKIYQDFLWSTWTNIKEAKGDDFGTYGIDRYNRAKVNIDKIMIELR